MPKKSNKGLEAYEKLRGFKKFIHKVETPKLKFLLKENPGYFDKTLPYAIALNEEKVWSKKFEDLITEPPTWYVSKSKNRFNTVYFVNKLSSNVSAMNNIFTSQPSAAASGKSGFSGGGGFSGDPACRPFSLRRVERGRALPSTQLLPAISESALEKRLCRQSSRTLTERAWAPKPSTPASRIISGASARNASLS